MILCELAKRYPVYTYHADEVLEVIRRLEKFIEQKCEWGEKDSIYRFYLNLLTRLDILLYELRSVSGSLAYVNKENRELVEKVVNWLKTQPEDKAR